MAIADRFWAAHIYENRLYHQKVAKLCSDAKLVTDFEVLVSGANLILTYWPEDI